MRAQATACFFGCLLLAAGPSRAGSLRLAAYPEGVRFDLLSGRFLVPPQDGHDLNPEQSILPSRPIELRAVRDEVVAFQVVVSGADGVHPVALSAPSTERGPSTIVASVFDERGIDVDTISDSPFVFSLGTGRYPDPLVPTATATVPFSRGIAVLWIDVFVPRGTEPGLHRFTLTVGDQTMDVEVSVLEATLPQVDAARIGAVNFGSFLDKERRKTLLSWMQLAHAHLLSVEIMRPTPNKGAPTAEDWEAWADRVAPWVEGTAFTEAAGYVGPRAGQPTGRFIIPLTDWWPVPATEAGLPSDGAAWSRALAEWERVVSKRGWLDRPNATEWVMFINSLDEPKSAEKLSALAAYKPLIDAAKLEHRERLHFRVDGNFGQLIPGFDDAAQVELLGPVVDLWNVHGAPWTFPWPLLEHRINERGERVMYYASNTSGEPSVPPMVIDSALTGARAWGWIIHRYGLAGALNWEVDTRAGCVEEPRCSPGRTMNLDGTLIYRGHEVGAGFDQPIASMRLKALRRGAQDAGLLDLLEAMDPKAAKTLEEKMVPRALGDRVPDTGRGAWSTEPLDWERAREAILDRLEGAAKKRPLDKVRVELGPRWLILRDMWPLGLGLGIGMIGLAGRFLWRRRRRA